MNEFWQKIWESWRDGGWIMLPLALVAVGIYAGALRALLGLSRRGFRKVTESRLRELVYKPDCSQCNLGEIVRYTQDDVKSLEEISTRFAEVNAAELPRIDRRLAHINMLVGTAPLLGLLGTVFGMLATFSAIAAGGSKMVDAMAQGISEALITTEMGLLVALPGMIFAYLIRRRRNEYAAALATLESLTLRKFRKEFGGMTAYFKKPEAERAEAVLL